MSDNPLSLLRQLVSRLLSLPPRRIKVGRAVRIRRPHKRITGRRYITIGDRTLIESNALIAPIAEYEGTHYQPQIKIGEDVYIGPNVYLVAISCISIGNGSVLSEFVFMSDNNHGLDPKSGLIMRQKLVHGGDIKIGNHCFLGLRSAIMPGVTLGDHCVVGINSVVTKSFPAYSMLAGAPAKLVKLYSLEKKAWIDP